MVQKKLTLILVLFPILLTAQPRFRAGVVAGLSASQIDGDISRGYNKLGFLGGLRVIARLKSRTEASMEILYPQGGCQNGMIPRKFDPTPFSFYPFLLYLVILFNLHGSVVLTAWKAALDY